MRRNIQATSIPILLSSISESTLKQYSACYKKYWAFCSEKNFSVFDYTLNNYLNFLTAEANKGGSYATINTYRSALNFILLINKEDENIIKRFVKGIFNIKPPQPKYNSTWNIQPVLQYLENLYPLQILTLEKLTLKLVTLMALTTGHRVQTLTKAKISNLIKTGEKIEIRIPDKIKSTGPNRYQPNLVFPYFSAKPELCVASTIEYYIEITSKFRSDIDELILTYRKPHHPASSQTVSRWIKSALKNSGINIINFGGHSVRHASTSAAFRAGTNINVIKNTAGWSESSEVFLKFYNRPIGEPNDVFANVILRLGLNETNK